MFTRTVLGLASLSFFACVAAGCSASGDESVGSSTAHVESSTVIYQHDASTPLATVSAREADRLLITVFTDYLRSDNECEKDPAGARIVPSVDGKIAGSFTGNNRNETLYVISVWDCDAGHADGYGNTRFVVTEPVTSPTGEIKVLANGQMSGVGTSINHVVDLDHDGQSELVLASGFTGQGYTTETASLVRFAGNNLLNDPAFEQFSTNLAEDTKMDSPFYTDDCGASDEPGRSVKFNTISATTSDGVLSFTAQAGQTACE